MCAPVSFSPEKRQFAQCERLKIMARRPRRSADDRLEPRLGVDGAHLDQVAKSHFLDQDLPAGHGIGVDYAVGLQSDRLRDELALNASEHQLAV